VPPVQRHVAADELCGEGAILLDVVGVGEVGQRHVRQLLRAVAHQFAEARIRLLHVAVEVGVADPQRHVVEDVAKALLAGAHGGLRLLALAHLLRQRRRALAHRQLDAPRPSGDRQQQRAEHRGRRQSHHRERPGVAAARPGQVERVGVDEQVPMAPGEGERPHVQQPRRPGLAAGGARQPAALRERIGVDDAHVEVAWRLVEHRAQRVLDAQGHEDDAVHRGHALLRRGGHAVVDRLVDHHPGLRGVGVLVLRQDEARRGDGPVAAHGAADGRRRRGNGHRVHPERAGVAGDRLDVPDGVHLVVGSDAVGERVAVVHAVVRHAVDARLRLEGRHVGAAHPLDVAHRLQAARAFEPGARRATQLAAGDLGRRQVDAPQRLQRVQRLLQLEGQRRGRVQRLALEVDAHALVVPACHQRDHRPHQQRDGRQREPHRQAARRPVVAWPADEGQHDRRGDQHAQ
jgi:hypothetical protein